MVSTFTCRLWQKSVFMNIPLKIKIFMDPSYYCSLFWFYVTWSNAAQDGLELLIALSQSPKY